MTRQLALLLAEPTPPVATPVPADPKAPDKRRRLVPKTVGPAQRADLHHQLERFLGKPLAALTLTDNRVTIFSSKRLRCGGLEMRIHAGFVEAPPEILQDVVVCSTVAGRTARTRSLRQASLERVRRFFDSLDLKPSDNYRHAPLVTRGTVYDLQGVFERINAEYFGGTVTAEITWGQKRRARRRRRSYSIQLGLFVYDDHCIRIHPILDSPKVPARVLDAVMHHEMVHAFLGQRGCEQAHGPEFRSLEATFKHLDEADLWLDQNLSKLIAEDERKRSD